MGTNAFENNNNKKNWLSRCCSTQTVDDIVVKVRSQQQEQRQYQGVRSNIHIHGGKLFKPTRLLWVLEASLSLGYLTMSRRLVKHLAPYRFFIFILSMNHNERWVASNGHQSQKGAQPIWDGEAAYLPSESLIEGVFKTNRGWHHEICYSNWRRRLLFKPKGLAGEVSLPGSV